MTGPRNKTALKELKQVMKQHLAQAEAVRAAQAQALAEQKKQMQQQQSDRQLFAATVGRVRPLKASDRVRLAPKATPPVPVQHWLDHQAVLDESLSDDFDVSTLLDTDADLSFLQPGVGHDVLRKLRRGHWSLQGEIDLHGLRSDEARAALTHFLHQALKRDWRCIRVVHGKGLGSPGRTPVLKQKVLRWLVQRQEVMAFVQAPANQGGAGALLVLLKGRML